jgi:ElaB/YqjD/DUF883 family membrane-anchored ribosome-binding protein
MALSIPIISSYDETGVKKAIKSFQQLETNSEKAQFAIKKAAVPAVAAIGALTAALGSAVKGAIEDAAAQDKLAEQIKRTTGATDAQIKANEDWISTQGKLLGITDDELRPALGGLVRATGSITEAQKLASAAMDISTAKGLSLETVTKALEKAYGGNMTALAKLSPELRQMIKDGASLDEVMQEMSKTFGGAASEAAETTAGKFKRMKVALDETKESIGASLMPAVEAALPYLQSMAQWAQDNPGVFTTIAATIGAVALSILAVNAAMALNPFGLIAVGIGVLVTGIGIAYTKFEGFRNLVRNVVNGLSDYFEFMANNWIKATNILITGINLISPFKDIPKMGSVSFGKIGPEDKGQGFTSARQAEAAMFGGGVSVSSAAPTPISSGSQMPSVTGGRNVSAPPPVLGGGTGGTDFGLGDISFTDMPLPNITVNTGVGDPVAIGKSIVDVLNAYKSRTGSLAGVLD